MSENNKDKYEDTKDTFQPSIHTYTPRSHEELLNKYSNATKKSTDLKYLKRENESLKKELDSSKNQLKILQQRVKLLEDKERNGLNTSVNSATETLSKPQLDKQFEQEVDSDDEYTQSWAMLGHHFSEVIRRHHEVLAEKDRLIRDLKLKCDGEYLETRISIPTREGASQTGCSLEEAPRIGMKKWDCCKPKNNKVEKCDINQAESSVSCYCADECSQCSFTNRPVSIKNSVINSGELLSEHFSEVIRRHKQQLQEKDMQIQELQDALACCIGGKPRRQMIESEVQMWNHDYYDRSQPCVEPPQRLPSSPTVVTRGMRRQRHRKSPDEDDSSGASTDTFVALEKCQRLESIANLERLRDNIIERLQLEEKLDKLYWQTELKRYREFREEAGDQFDPNCTINKDFEMLETTRLELLRVLKEVKETCRREPEIYVKPHSILCDSECLLNDPTVSNCEDKRRVKFTECPVTKVITKHDTDDI